MTRIAFIGAGSVEFTRNLLGDIFSFPELADAEIVLHDIDEERLDTAVAMARWTNDTLGARGRISATTDRRRALDGADFAINVIQVGGHAATRLDFEIPKKYGLRQTIGDTLGIGGIFRALRSTGYDNWLTIEAFGRVLPAFAAATRIWRDIFESPDALYAEGITFIRQQWSAAA